MFFMKGIEEFLFNTFPSARYASGKSEIVIRCPFCGDSKDPKNAHLYISIAKDKPHYFHCFKCNESGILNSKTLRRMSVYDVEASIQLDEYNKKVASKIPSKGKYLKYFLRNDRIRDNELSLAKLKYINHRLGINLTYQDCLDNKIVLNLYDLLNSNKISKLTRHPNIVNQLDECFIGFISMDNNFVTLRNIVPPGKVHESIDRRYTEYNIFGANDNSHKGYCIPTTIDTLNPNPIRIHISEGVFDILSVFYNLNNGNKYQSIYYAMCGKNYEDKLMMFITDYGFINVEYHIYIDNDIQNYIIDNLRHISRTLKINVYIHQNRYNGEKDFGVKRSKIHDYVYIL